MEYIQTLSPGYKAAVLPSLTRSAKKKQGFVTLLFRYALPFIFFNSVAVGVASFLYFIRNVSFSFMGTGFFLYCSSFILLAVLRKGFGGRRSRLFTFLYIMLVLILLGGFVIIIVTRVADIHIIGLFNRVFWFLQYLIYIALIGIVFFVLIISFILLPFMNIGFVVWKTLAKKIEILMPRLFPGISHMNPREVAVRMGCSLVLLSSSGYATLIEPNTLRVEEVEIVSPKVTEEVTILHLTDMHIHSIGRFEHKLFRRIQQLNPDIIVQTGDLMDLYDPERRDQEVMKKLADLFQQLTPKYGTYWIVGNHDYGLEKIDWFYERAGVKLLHDDEWLIAGDEGHFRLLGLSCAKSWWHRDRAFIEEWANKAGENEFTIVMGHAPDFIPDIVDQDIDLCLAGHLHGGQVHVPVLDRIIIKVILHELGSHFPAEWASGYREVNNIRMNVSVGTSGSHSIRFNCPPTITLFRVKKS